MNKAKTPLLRKLLKNLNQASFLNKHPENDEDAISELYNRHLYSRRKFIFDSAKAVALIGLTSSIPFISCKNKTDRPVSIPGTTSKKQPVIAIIGGGIAGLNCAYQLKKKNIIAQVYEADKKTGGRINSRKDLFGDGLVTEFGGEFIDTDNKDMLDLVKEFNLELYDTHKDINENKLEREIYYFKNQVRSEKDVIREFRRIIKKIESDKTNCGDYTNDFAVKLDNQTLEQYITELHCENWFKDLLKYAYTAEFGLDTGSQSALNFVDMVGVDTTNGFKIFGDSDERFKIKGGNAIITEKLFEQVKDQISTGMKLTSIRNESSGYVLGFEGAKEIKADYIVIAIPFTMLRQVDLKLNDISQDKLKCIKELGYGQNNKLILGMKNRFWREKPYHSSGYVFHPEVQNGWDSSQMQTSNSGGGSYTIFLGGEASARMARAAKDQNLKDSVPQIYSERYLNHLNRVYKGIKNSYTGINKAALWSNNPFINASYATYKTGQWTSVSGKEIEPVGNVFFAGEHCSSQFQGYMNGAAETGRVAAENILVKIKV